MHTLEKIETALTFAETTGAPVVLDARTLQEIADQLRTIAPKGRVQATAWDRGYAAGALAESRANAAGERALTDKVAKAIALVGKWESDDGLRGEWDAPRIAAAELRDALGLGDVQIVAGP